MRKTSLPRVLIIVAAVALASAVFGPGAYRACLTRGGAQLVTKAKLQNLKPAMAQLSILAARGVIPFPTGRDGVLDYIQQEWGESVSRDDTDLENPLVDGWGTPMQLQGDQTAYEIRSAGADRIFFTPDDLVLQGDTGGEYILTGGMARVLTRGDLPDPSGSPLYQDPGGFYAVRLPDGYAVIPSSLGSRSQVTFSYAKDMRVTIAREPAAGGFEPDEALGRRLDVLRRGEDEWYQEFALTGYETAAVGEAAGFSITLERGAVLVREIRLKRTRDSALLIITIVTTGPDRRAILDALDQAVRETLVLRG